MGQFSKEEFERNIGKENMQSHDQDLKFMGAHEICKMVQNDLLTNTMPEMDRYIDGLFAQLNKDVTQEVKGNAVTCMSKISAKLTAEQIERIVKILIKQITSTDEEIKDIRDVFVMCLKNIIQQVPHDFHDKIKIVISESIKGIQDSRKGSEENVNVEQELIEIITHMFRKWGAIYNDASFKVIVELLKSNIISLKVDDNLRKKSCISLGVVSVMLTQQEVQKLVQELTKKHNEIKNAQQDQQKIKAISSALNSLSKTVSTKMAKEIPSQIELLKRGFSNWGLQEDAEDFDFVSVVCELYESYLSNIEHLIKGCSITDFSKEQKKDLIQISVQLMQMDPNNNCDIEDQDEEEEMGSDEEDSDDYSDEDQDDQSWRVRRGAMLLLEQIILTDKQLLDNIYHSTISPQVENNKQNIIKRLRERNEGVRQTIIKVLTSFINQIMVKEHQNQSHDQDDFGISEELTLKRVTSKLTQFELKDVIQSILQEIKQIFKDKRTNSQIKLQLFKMIENISSSGGKQILEQQTTWSTTFALLSDILKDSQSSTEIKVSCLISLRRILKFRGKADLRHIKNDIILIFNFVESKLIVSDQFRINAESLKLTSGLFRIIQECFSEEISQFTPSINKLLPHIITKLQQTDVDQEIKHAVISVASGILVHIGKQIETSQLELIFESLQKKLKSENKNRITILKLYKKIPNDLKSQLSSKCLEILNSTIQLLSTFLNKEDRSERIATLDALNKLFQILGKNIQQAIASKIIDLSLYMLKPKDQKETDPSIACTVLSIYKQIITIFPSQQAQYTQITGAMLNLTKSSIFQTNRYEILYELFQQMAQLKIINIDSTVKELFKESKHETIISSSKAISSLVLQAPNKDQIITSIAKDHALKSHGSDEDTILSQRQMALLTLCEIGKKQNLTQNKDIFQGVIDLIVNQKEDLDKIRKYASIALGGISLSDLDFVLPKIIDLIHKQNNPYLMLNTVKEIIQNSSQINEKSLQQIVDFLFKQAALDSQLKEQDLKNIISECIGKIALQNLKLVKSHLLSSIKSTCENARYTAAASFKFFFTEQGRLNANEQDLHEVLKSLFTIINDNSIKVREAVIKSLNSIAFNTPLIIEEEIKGDMFEHLKTSFTYFDVQETDLGAFKDKRDKGAPLRTAAFQFLQNCLNFKNCPDFYEGIIQACFENMAKESEAEIKILRIQILLKIAESAPVKTIPYVIKIQTAIVSVIKVFANDKPIPDSNMDLVRTSLRVFHAFDQLLGDSCPVEFTNFLQKLKVQNNGKFGKIFDTFN